MRTIVIGDIHGGYKALLQLLDRIGLQATDKLIFLGDYVDGWSESFETVNFLISLSRKRQQDSQEPPVFLRGNHDELMVDNLQKKSPNPMWLHHGGKSTLRSYTNRSSLQVNEHLNFLTHELLDYYESDGNGYFHAGFHNLKGPAYEYYPKMTYWDRSLWEMALALDPSLEQADVRFPNRLKLYKEIFIGHTPTNRLGTHQPVQAANVWNVDTAAAYKGPLTALCVQTKEIWQSDPVHQLYPGEQGRN
ncbi:metallophosphoesterase [Nonlabens xiamenensis]|uniref:metallophosphoesterase n=1 Tax=Nonlabens xiamenensis TaxID=2341043 RepID=UPI000F60CE86|nr:metallophosphoesterase [Nonlabens xiamenensis]